MSVLTCMIFVSLCLGAPALLAAGEGNSAADTQPRVSMKTNKGTIVIELDSEKAPKTVENFLSYVKAGFYDGTTFHRVIDGFMIQGGGFTPEMVQKGTEAPIRNEADNQLHNQRGSIAMARTSVVDSATSQFFINLKDNSFLDYRGPTPQDYGYAVFGRVVEGMDVVDAIAKEKTGMRSGHHNVPLADVIIEKATLQSSQK